MRIAVVGANGFIGKSIVDNLSKYYEIVPITRENYYKYIGQYFDVLINAAGSAKKYLAEAQPIEDFKENVLSVYKSLVDFKYDKYIYLSSIDAANIKTTYGFHKSLAENIIYRVPPFEYKCFIMRLGAVIGPGMKKGIVYDLINHKELRVTEDSTFHIITTKAISSRIKDLLENKRTGGTYTVAGNGNISVKKMAEILNVDYTISKDANNCWYDLNYIPFVKTSEEYLKEFINDRSV